MSSSDDLTPVSVPRAEEEEPEAGGAVSAAPGGAARGAVVLVVSASTIILMAGIRSAAGIIAPAFLALVLTIVVHPIQRWARSKGWPSWTGGVITMVSVYLMLLGLAGTVVASMSRLATLIPTYADDWNNLIDDATGLLGHVGVGADQQQTVLSAFDPGKLTDFILSLLGNLASLASSFFFLVTLVLFLALDASAFPARLAAVRPGHAPLIDSLTSFAHGTRRYYLVSTIFGLIVGVIDTIALALLGIPAPVVWGFLAFVTNYIPNIGFVIGLVPPALLALLEGGPSLMLWVIAIYCVVNFVIQTVIQPRVVGDAVGLSGTLTFLSLIFWSWILGPLGALLAIPLTLLLKAIFIDADPNARWMLPVLTGDPPKPPSDPASAES